MLETLKGPAQRSLAFPGELVDQDDFNDDPKVPRTWIRPDGRHGSCYATRYRRGGSFLLMIRNGSPYWQPLTPTNEQIPSPADPWVQWVKQAIRNGGAKP